MEVLPRAYVLSNGSQDHKRPKSKRTRKIRHTSDKSRHAKEGRHARNPVERARAAEAKVAATEGCRCNGICKLDWE